MTTFQAYNLCIIVFQDFQNQNVQRYSNCCYNQDTQIRYSYVSLFQDLEENGPVDSERTAEFDVMAQMNYKHTAMSAKQKDMEYKCKQQEKEMERLKDKLHLMSVQVSLQISCYIRILVYSGETIHQ